MDGYALATQAHGDARGERHPRVATAALHLVRLLAADLDDQIRLSPEERADALARGLSLGIVAALKEAGPAHAVLRLRALAGWLTRAADRIEAPVAVATPADVPAALAQLDARRVA
jgi:hypothetical protein